MMNNVFVYNYHTAKVCFIEINYMEMEKRDPKSITYMSLFFLHILKI